MILSHITINTKKIEESIAFYQDVLGLRMVRDLRGQGARNIVFLSDGKNEVNIELVENPDYAYRGSGISIGFVTDDLDHTREELISRGIKPGLVLSPNPHTRFFFILDPSGVQIQFIEEKL